MIQFAEWKIKGRTEKHGEARERRTEKGTKLKTTSAEERKREARKDEAASGGQERTGTRRPRRHFTGFAIQFRARENDFDVVVEYEENKRAPGYLLVSVVKRRVKGFERI